MTVAAIRLARARAESLDVKLLMSAYERRRRPQLALVSTTATAASFGFLSFFIDPQPIAIERLAVQSRDGGPGFVALHIH